MLNLGSPRPTYDDKNLRENLREDFTLNTLTCSRLEPQFSFTSKNMHLCGGYFLCVFRVKSDSIASTPSAHSEISE